MRSLRVALVMVAATALLLQLGLGLLGAQRVPSDEPGPPEVVLAPEELPLTRPTESEVVAAALDGRRPNFLVILSDDQRFDSWPYMPETHRRIALEGTVYPNAFVTTPVCCPSRATILTGQYGHTNGVQANEHVLEGRTFVEDLHDAGYRTSMVGKYLNSWDGRPRPEFDHWVAFPGGDSRYTDPQLYVDGRLQTVPGHITYILRDHALAFLDEAAQHDEPFLLYFAPNAPHRPATPAPAHRTLHADLAPHRPPSYMEADRSDKPAWLQRATLDAKERTDLDTWRLDMLRSLAALDEAVVALLERLEEQGKLDETVVIYLSDNGFFWGEHGLRGKGAVYDEATRVPFAVRYPPLVPAGASDTSVVANLDVAPTLLELAGLGVPDRMEGLQMTRLWLDTGAWRSFILLEARGAGWPYVAVHSGTDVYVETRGDRAEYYDLVLDPFQLENAVDAPENAARIAEMQRALANLTANARFPVFDEAVTPLP